MKNQILCAVIPFLACGSALSTDELDDLFNSFIQEPSNVQSPKHAALSSLPESPVTSPSKTKNVIPETKNVIPSRMETSTIDELDDLFNSFITPTLNFKDILVEAGIKDPTAGQVAFTKSNFKLNKLDLLKGVMKVRLVELGIEIPTSEQLNFAASFDNLNKSNEQLLEGAMRARLVELHIEAPTFDQLKFIIENAHLNDIDEALVQAAMKVRLVICGIKFPTQEQLNFATNRANLNLESRHLVRGAMNARLIACGINVPTPEQLDFAVRNLNVTNTELKEGAAKARLLIILGCEPKTHEIRTLVNNLNIDDKKLRYTFGIKDLAILQRYHERRLQRENLFELNPHSYYLEALKLFGVDLDANDNMIKSAYKKLSIKHHPDRNFGNEEAAEAAFKEVNCAKTYIDFYREKKIHQPSADLRLLSQDDLKKICDGW